MTSSVPGPTAALLQQLVDTHAIEAQDRYDALAAGRTFNIVADMVSPTNIAAQTLLLPVGAEDAEHSSNANGLQHDLCKEFDELRLDELSDSLRAQHRWEDIRRICELRDPNTVRDWLWSLNPAHGPIVAAKFFLTCIRIRIGVDIIEDVMLCSKCDKQILDTACAHALCCAPGQSTRGHNCTRNAVLQLVHLADSTAEPEVTGLIPNAPTLRPADVFTTSGYPGCQAALDIGICSPNASGAGDDCCAAMFERKMDTYSDHLGALGARNIRYKPIVYSCYGRPHPESLDTLERIAQQAARRHGLADHRALLTRSLLAISIQIWTRAAAMVHACLPEATAEAVGLLFGDYD